MKLFSIIVLLALNAAASGAEQPLLPPDQAYRYSVSAGANELSLKWEALPGYYLYREKFGFRSLTPGVVLGDADMPDGKIKTDEFFGEMEIYRGAFEITIPVRRSDASVRSLELEIKSQGCADIGICFPPQTWQTNIALPAAAAGKQQAPSASLLELFGTDTERQQQGDILPPEEAFVLSAGMAADNRLLVRWDIAPGYYLYRDKIRLQAEPESVSLGEPVFPAGVFKEDEYFGRSEVYFTKLEVALPLATTDQQLSEFLLLAESQGCKDNGICYPPFAQNAPVALAAGVASQLPAQAATAGKISEQARLATLIRDSNLALVLLTFFGLGLLLAFTPCVLPMIPILSGIIARQGDDVSTRRAFLLSLTYVLGMAVTYTAAGATAALFGQQLQAIFQQTWIIVGFAGLFVVLALSMFGLFELQMPGAIQSRASELSNRQQAGTYIGTAVMGILSALIVTACVAPPLVATLAVIGQAGEPARGAAALFAMSLGMGAPLLVVGASAGKLLPKAGAWMNAVKAAFGVMLLGVAIYILERILPHAVTMFLWGTLLVVTGVFMGAPRALGETASGWHRLWRALGLVITAYGLLMLVGVAAGGKDTWRPLSGTSFGGGAASVEHGLDFTRVKTVADLDAAVAGANAAGQFVMLDFYADWCVSCLEMEKYTFTDKDVQNALEGVLVLQADVTANDGDDKALLNRFGIYGPPTIAFFDPAGRELEGYRIAGFMPADEFSAHVREALAAGAP
ncbi:MAG: protein-disulfide reductase DsbD [Gammaproteobacteria bacterium]|nr:protein-disulfide reductase DsbD [Gammaproteobacteria bacterium]